MDPLSPGDRVLFWKLPPWVEELPEESRSVFRFCVGKSFRVSEIDENGVLVLDVSKEVDARFGGFLNDIRIEPEFLRVVEE